MTVLFYTLPWGKPPSIRVYGGEDSQTKGDDDFNKEVLTNDEGFAAVIFDPHVIHQGAANPNRRHTHLFAISFVVSSLTKHEWVKLRDAFGLDGQLSFDSLIPAQDLLLPSKNK